MKIGILGGGQLARMLALAGYPLGLEFIIVEPNANFSAIGLGKHLHGKYTNKTLLEQFANLTEVITYEFENIPAQVTKFLTEYTCVYPTPNALAVAQDRLLEKQFFGRLNIPTTKYVAVNNLQDLKNAMSSLSYPAILKSRRMGYDGKGQIVLQSAEQLGKVWDAMQGVACIVEVLVAFQREVSIIAARRPEGQIVFYPISENKHNHGILRTAECRLNYAQQQQAENYVVRLLDALDYVGIIALELFEINGQLLANEFAPRVHNSGHWTIEGAETSQFENHLRAILNLPLGSTKSQGFVGMVNFIGGLPDLKQILAIPNTHIHFYSKTPRKGRKMGHVTIKTNNADNYAQSFQSVLALAQATDNS